MVYGNTLKTFFAIDAARRLNLPSLWNIRESEPWQTYYSYLPDAVACRAPECFGFPIALFSPTRRAPCSSRSTAGTTGVIHDGLTSRSGKPASGGWDRLTSRHEWGVGAGAVVVVLPGTVWSERASTTWSRHWRSFHRKSPVVCAVSSSATGREIPSRRLAGLVQQLPPALRHRVHVIGETRDVARYYQAADLFVCTSRVESYPRVTLAMACGLPIISTPSLACLSSWSTKSTHSSINRATPQPWSPRLPGWPGTRPCGKPWDPGRERFSRASRASTRWPRTTASSSWKRGKRAETRGLRPRLLRCAAEDPGASMADADFNEQDYLAANPDVASAVGKGQFRNGWEHFETFGRKEGRPLNHFGRMSRKTRHLRRGPEGALTRNRPQPQPHRAQETRLQRPHTRPRNGCRPPQ
ncbi:MAG: glycosyltransferase family 4 protein [Betaproteobacteria bacterium]|nr:glycosyltransferase family 4 protein [Betaproteobacteria bacterium]